jgi:hypothetical protein
MTGGKGVIGTFLTPQERMETVLLPNARHLIPSSGQNLVRICLMPHIPDNLIKGGVIHIMESNGKLHDPETGGQVPAGAAHGVNKKLPKLLCQNGKLFHRELTEILRRINLRKERTLFIS